MAYLINATKHQLKSGMAYDAYRSYLDSIKARLPDHIYKFATAEWHYNPSDRKSLHDAWLEKLFVIENAKGVRNELRSVSVLLHLLGAYHDRVFKLCYTDVSFYEIKNPSAKKGHGDLMVDEISLSRHDRVVHEIQFSTGALLKIECADFTFSQEERPIKPRR